MTQAPVADDQHDQLAGFRIGVTSDRRSEDMIAAFERRGARVLHAPALKIAPLTQDTAMLRDTRKIIASAPDITLVTTAYGMRRWAEAADAAGLGEDLIAALGASRILVRGPKARGAVRAIGLDDAGAAPDERTASLVDTLLDEGVGGRTVAVQLHGYPDLPQLQRLRAAGAHVLTVTPYRWVKPDGAGRLPRLIEAVCARQVDVLTFTSAPAVDALLSTAHEAGLHDQLIEALRTDVLTAAVGHVTAAPLVAAGIEPLVPQRPRMGALIREVCEHLTLHRVERVATAVGPIEIRGHLVLMPGRGAAPVYLAPGPLAVFRALAMAHGAVLSREELVAAMPELESSHALEMIMSRLRQALPDREIIKTVVKRGYRLNV